MKKTSVAGLAAVSLLSVCVTAQASNGRSFYLGLKGDVANPATSDIKGAGSGNVKYGFSSGIGGVLGWTPQVFRSNSGDVRTELEASYHAFGLKSVASNSNPSSDMKVTTLMANVYYDWYFSPTWSPYVGIGFGQAHVKFATGQGLGNSKASDTVNAKQVMIGLTYTPRSTSNSVWSFGYKYLDVSQPSFSAAGGNIKLKPVNENTIELSYRHYF